MNTPSDHHDHHQKTMATRTFFSVRKTFVHCVMFSFMIYVLISLSYYVNLHTSIFGKKDEYYNVAPEEKIDDDVYHTPEEFRMNYAKMEMKLKIYAYPADDQYTNYQTISGKYASEGYFFKNLRESSFLTDNPRKAHLFFIPISPHKMHQKVSSYDEMAKIIGEYIQSIITKYPYWNRTLGADHFFLTCHDIDVGATKWAPPLVIKNMIHVVCSPTYNSGFIMNKDVSLPLIVQPLTTNPRPGVNDTENRRILGYWGGVCNSKIREKMVKLWRRDQELEIQNLRTYYNGRMNKFYSSKFCICPAGSRITSSRITMAIRYGCVPVIMSDYYALPFEDVLNWRNFSVILKERDVYNLKATLKAKEGAEYSMLHSNLLKVQKRFVWNTPPVKYDAFHMVLYELWLRRFAVKY